MDTAFNQSDFLSKLRNRKFDLGMNFETLSTRSGVSVSTLKRMLGRAPVDASISDTMAVAEALGVTLSLRMSSVDQFRERQANLKARKLVQMVQGTSALESQAVDQEHIKRMIERSVRDLLSGPSRKLWAS